MTALPPEVIVLERVARHAPVALRLIDVATGAPVTEQLVIEIAPRAGGTAVTAVPSRGGVWVAAGLPGLRDYEFGADDSVASRRAARRPFRITVRDAAGRYLPFAFDAALPTDDLLVAPPTGPLPHLPPWSAPPASPPAPVPAALPLFSAPARVMPQPIGVITAELRRAGSDLPAAWALLQATIDGEVRGLGLADRLGRASVRLPYPPSPPPMAPVSPPAPARSRWMVELTAFYLPDPREPAPETPDLAQVLAQLVAPRRLLAAIGSPPLALPPLELHEGVPLVARSGPPSAPSPFLFLEAA